MYVLIATCLNFLLLFWLQISMEISMRQLVNETRSTRLNGIHVYILLCFKCMIAFYITKYGHYHEASHIVKKNKYVVWHWSLSCRVPRATQYDDQHHQKWANQNLIWLCSAYTRVCTWGYEDGAVGQTW